MEWSLKNHNSREYNIHHVLFSILSLILIIMLGRTNYILFHSIIEIITTAICFSLVIIVVNTYNISNNYYFIYLGILYGFISIFNFMHAIAYTDVLSLSKNPIDLSIQLNISYRLLEGFSLAASFIFLYKTFKPHVVFYFYAFISSTLLYIILYTNWIPSCFTYNYGLTSFENICEYIILLLLITSIVLFIINRKYFSKTVVFYMSLYLIFTILVRVLYVISSTVYNDFSLLSHFFKFISYYFLYKALVEEKLKQPLNSLFYNLSNKNTELNLRTLELEKTIAELNNKNINLEKLKEELQISKDRYTELMEFLPDGVILRDGNEIVYANNATIKLVRAKSQEELIGKSPFDFVHPDCLDDLEEKLKNEREGIVNYFNFHEYKLVTLDGETIDVELKSTTLKEKEKNFYMTVIYDIRERKKAEEFSKLLNEAHENNKLKTEFFANLSHELRTPINVIYSALQVIDLNVDEKVTKKYNLIIKQNCYRLLRLVNNIIDSTKIDAGFLKLNLIYKNIVPVIEDIALSISSYIKSKGMTLIFDTEVEEIYLDFDPDLIERIILNLLSNAVKFGNENGIISVNIFKKEHSLIISVMDDGIGIPENQQTFIFDRFKQIDKSFTRYREGSGIGLSLVKSLVELHKGTIILKSKENIGSEFIIELPIFETLKYAIKAKEITQDNIVQKINIEFSDIYS